MHRIAVVEDDPELGDYMLQLLKRGGYETSLLPSAGRFFDYLIKTKPDMVLLDMNLPGMHGSEIIRVLRANPQTKQILIIAMSGANRKTSDVIGGFQAGADEYMVKPVNADLLLARAASLLRRSQGAQPAQERIQIGKLTLLPEERLCRLNGDPVRLTRLEFDLLVYFIRQANRVLTRSVILETVWQGDPAMTTRTVDKHVETLRRKLKNFGRNFETIIGMGYRLRL